MAHLHEKIDFTAETFIVHNERVLLRKHDKYKLWLSIGGHIELHEDPTETARREVREEVGLEITLFGTPETTSEDSSTYRELLPPRFLNRHRINETHEHVSLTYFATSTSDQVTPEHTEDEWRWFTVEELDDPHYNVEDRIKHYAKAALAEIKNAS